MDKPDDPPPVVLGGGGLTVLALVPSLVGLIVFLFVVVRA